MDRLYHEAVKKDQFVVGLDTTLKFTKIPACIKDWSDGEK